MKTTTTIGFFETTLQEKAFIDKSLLKKHKVVHFDKEFGKVPSSAVSGLDVVSVFIYSKLDKAALAPVKRLKLVATRSTGFDHIDLDECRRRNIPVTNVPFYGENTVAEHTFGLILSISRNIHKAYMQTIQRNFSMEGLQGFDLQGKTLGVIGTGHIGLHVIRMAKGFGMKVLAFDVKPNHFMTEVLGFDYVSLKELLQRSDIITLHAPHNKNTHHMINEETLKWVKRGALLINTARGGLVDTAALAKALDQGVLSGAGLDVLEGEDLVKEERQILSKQFSEENLKTLLQNHILLNRENVVITPHIAFNSLEAYQRILSTTIDNILAFLEGKPQNIVA